MIHHFLEAVIQAWTGTAWTRTRTSNFSTSFRFCFCSEVSELHGWSPDGHAKIINIFCEGVMTADPNREHVGPSSRVHSCQNLFVSVQKRNHHFWFHEFFCMSALFLIFTKLARILWLIFFVKNRMCKNCKMTPLKLALNTPNTLSLVKFKVTLSCRFLTKKATYVSDYEVGKQLGDDDPASVSWEGAKKKVRALDSVLRAALTANGAHWETWHTVGRTEQIARNFSWYIRVCYY